MFPGSLASDDMFQVETTKAQTTSATPLVVWNKTLPQKSALFVRVAVVGVKSDGTDRACYERAFTVYRTTSTATIQGAVVAPVPDSESDASWDVTCAVSTNDVQVLVTGKSSTTINWRVRVQLVQV